MANVFMYSLQSTSAVSGWCQGETVLQWVLAEKRGQNKARTLSSTARLTSDQNKDHFGWTKFAYILCAITVINRHLYSQNI